MLISGAREPYAPQKLPKFLAVQQFTVGQVSFLINLNKLLSDVLNACGSLATSKQYVLWAVLHIHCGFQVLCCGSPRSRMVAPYSDAVTACRAADGRYGCHDMSDSESVVG